MLIGHAAQRRSFLESVAGGRLHHGWLLAGPEGIGKRAFADWAALALLSGEPQFEAAAAHPAARLVAAGSHPDHRVLTRLVDDKGKVAAEIRVDEVRALLGLLRGTAVLGRWRTIIIDAAEDMNRAAANALLKGLEEPPRDTVFLLVSHAPGRLLPTIRSRCRRLDLRPLPEGEVAAVLRAERVAEADVAALAAAADGAPGAVLALAPEAFAGLDAALERVLAGGDGIAFARSFQPVAAQGRFEALLRLAPRRIARLAQTRLEPALAPLYEEADALALSARRLAHERGQVALALADILARAGRLAAPDQR
jgi:DNA polymerase-3 subunit delta'